VSFAPVYNEHSRALILGTWPSPKSREMSFYYGHPQNRFWPMLAALTGEPVPAREDIEAKKQIILRHGLALWDTLESCTITGASDASIRDVVPNDIAGLLAKVPIEAVFCNGATAYKIYTKYLEPVSGIPTVRLQCRLQAGKITGDLAERIVELDSALNAARTYPICQGLPYQGSWRASA